MAPDGTQEIFPAHVSGWVHVLDAVPAGPERSFGLVQAGTNEQPRPLEEFRYSQAVSASFVAMS